ncbi:ATP-dependent DNA helicase q5-like [Plakobranchus ocellatus]|uniref:ATP-dependent DNA helicase q5-like n=1 Tax=Plakobranchus ocellatus TaxID=259542 RepID=A0AAV3XV44_9GAST|nr:ATP-dependent DNA helicase q5-like [Plakobranchus ocellatus]
MAILLLISLVHLPSDVIRETEDYDRGEVDSGDEGEYHRERAQAEREKVERTSIIQKEFQKRKVAGKAVSGAKKETFEEPSPFCPLRDASSQRIPKLTVKTREHCLEMLEKAFYENFVAAFKEHKRIVNREIESRDCALNAEHEVFLSSKLAASYKSSIMKLISEARKLTQTCTSHPCFAASTCQDNCEGKEVADDTDEKDFISHAPSVTEKGRCSDFSSRSDPEQGVPSTFVPYSSFLSKSSLSSSSSVGKSNQNGKITMSSAFQTASELLALDRGVNKPFKPPASTRPVSSLLTCGTYNNNSSIDSNKIQSVTPNVISSTRELSKEPMLSLPQKIDYDLNFLKEKDSVFPFGFNSASNLKKMNVETAEAKMLLQPSAISDIVISKNDDESNSCGDAENGQFSQDTFPEVFKNKAVHFGSIDSPTDSKNLFIDLTSEDGLNYSKTVTNSVSSAKKKSLEKKTVSRCSNTPKIVYFFERKNKEEESTSTDMADSPLSGVNKVLENFGSKSISHSESLDDLSSSCHHYNSHTKCSSSHKRSSNSGSRSVGSNFKKRKMTEEQMSMMNTLDNYISKQQKPDGEDKASISDDRHRLHIEKTQDHRNSEKKPAEVETTDSDVTQNKTDKVSKNFNECNHRKQIADFVVKYLTPYYKYKCFASKDLFKAVAKAITEKVHVATINNPVAGKEEAKRLVKSFMSKHKQSIATSAMAAAIAAAAATTTATAAATAAAAAAALPLLKLNER